MSGVLRWMLTVYPCSNTMMVEDLISLGLIKGLEGDGYIVSLYTVSHFSLLQILISLTFQ